MYSGIVHVFKKDHFLVVCIDYMEWSSENVFFALNNHGEDMFRITNDEFRSLFGYCAKPNYKVHPAVLHFKKKSIFQKFLSNFMGFWCNF